MFVLANFNPVSKISRAKSLSNGFATPHLILCRRNPFFGIRFGFKSPYSEKTSIKQQKTCRQHVVQATHLVAGKEDHARNGFGISRRFTILLGLPMLAAMAGGCENALAVKQLQLAGRVPGLSPPNENGMRTYRRPDAKSGGHGVGWSPIIPYTFTAPPDWEEVPVSIADLGGTEIDLRFANKKEGNVSVVVAPVLRFADADDNVKIEDIGTPEKVIYAFGPELIGQNIEGKLKNAEVKEHSGRTYYQYELEAPHALISATAAGNRMYLMTVSANGLQWKKYFSNLKQIAESFRVD